ncbi:hypothetical protein GH5_06004 [Leishmania sp. Ghana 2012 LV757]|uniref:hypothetical protein n=1 Tax=Leishmania sp. Ghana 2012 LV757 TaxID=2803181 RepID=UPI001B6E3D6C|nr:hypothetical protein GH5_06004 [Leishmania sp. Ghana 2012 LV757]
MRRTRRSLEAGMSVVSRILMQSRMTGRSGAHTDTAGVARRCSTVASTLLVGSVETPSTAKRPARRLRLAVVRPDLLDDWVPELNDVVAQQISCDEATTLVWWRCSRCQKRYQCTVQARVALGRTACPSCGGNISAAGGASLSRPAAVSAAHTQSEVTAPRVEAGETLDKTHPHLVARWDFARNGTLLPSQVTASSTRPVWWLPAAGTASLASPAAQSPCASAQRSFLRPVFAFVYNSASPEEQAAATAAMEWRLLHEIRRVAHIEAAETAGTIPVSLSGVRDGAPNAAGWLTGSGSAAASESPPPLTAMSAADARVVARLWKDRVSRLSTAENEADDTPPELLASRLAGALPRELFAHSPAEARRVASSADAVAASRVREALLGQYCEFVSRQRRGSSSSEKRMSLTPILASLAQSSTTAATAASTAAEETPPSWTDFFALARDEVLPKGCIGPSAALYFPDAVEAVAPNAAAAAVPEGGKSDSLRLALSQMQPAVLIKYPRRPPSPRLREDDVMQATPPMMSAGTGDAYEPHVGKNRPLTYPVHVPFGHVTTAAEEKAAKLTAEYDIDDDDAGRGNGSGPIQTADGASTFAAELRGAQRGSDTSPSGAVSHHGEAATAASLVESAIAALGEAFSAAEAGSRSRRYHRETHRAEALNDEMVSSNLAGRQAGKSPRRFRLSLPQEAPQRRRGSATRETIGADGLGAVKPMHFDAPQAPRKVARPRRARTVAPNPTAE